MQKQRPRDPKEDDDDTEERERPRLKIGGRREERRLLKAVLTFTTFRKREMRMVKKRTFDDALARKETTESTVFVFASIFCERCRLMNTTTLKNSVLWRTIRRRSRGAALRAVERTATVVSPKYVDRIDRCNNNNKERKKRFNIKSSLRCSHALWSW